MVLRGKNYLICFVVVVLVVLLLLLFCFALYAPVN